MATQYPKIEETNYFTNRALENEKGEKIGKIIMWRLKGEDAFHYILKCPFCAAMTERDERFERKPYRPGCDSCGKNVLVEKIKTPKGGK